MASSSIQQLSLKLKQSTDHIYKQSSWSSSSWESTIADFFKLTEKELLAINENHSFFGTREVYQTFSFLFDFRNAIIPICLSGPSGVGKSKSFEMISAYDASASKFSYIFKPSLWKIIDDHSSTTANEFVSFLKLHHHPWNLDIIITSKPFESQKNIYSSLVKFLKQLKDQGLQLFYYYNGQKNPFQLNRLNDDESYADAIIRIVSSIDSIMAANLFYSKTLHANSSVSELRTFLTRIHKLASHLCSMTTIFQNWVKTSYNKYASSTLVNPHDTYPNAVSDLHPPVLTVFLDELNTTTLMSVLSNLFVHHQFGNTELSPNIWLCGAINPKEESKNSMDLYAHVYKLTPSLARITIPFPSFGKTFDDQFLKRQKLKSRDERLLRKARDFCIRQFETSTNRDTKILTSVSLRDCSRFVELYEYFSHTRTHTGNGNGNGNSSKNPQKQPQKICWLSLTPSKFPNHPVLASLCLAFYLRLDTKLRLQFLDFVFNSLDSSLKKQFIACHKRMITTIFEIVSDSLPKLVCKTDALAENLFASVTAIALKMPIFLIGAPGSSKTLSYNIIQEATSDTNKPLVKFIGRIRTFRIQGSELLSAHQVTDLITTAENQEALQQQQNSKNSADIGLSQSITVFFDETSLPSRQKGTLKSLHKPLDDRKVSFIGVGNNPIGNAIQNRALCVLRPSLDTNSIYDIAKIILKSSYQGHEIPIATLQNLLKGFQHAIKTFKIHSSRDFIQLLVSILRSRENKSTSNDSISQDDDLNTSIFKALSRNFLGLEKKNLKILFSRFLNYRTHGNFKLPSQFKQFFQNLMEPKQLKSEIPVRFPLLMDDSPDDSALRLVIYKTNTKMMSKLYPGIDKLVNKFKLEYFSQYPVDLNSKLYAASYLFRLTQQMNAGNYSIISHADPVSGALFDVLNQRFSPSDDDDYLEAFISISKIDRKERIHAGFNLISHVSVFNRQSPYSHLPTAYLSRFEKFRISFPDLAYDLIDEFPGDESTLLRGVLKRIEKFFIALTQYHSSLYNFDYYSFFVDEIMSHTSIDSLLTKPKRMNNAYNWGIDNTNGQELIFRWFLCGMCHSLPPAPFLSTSASYSIVPRWLVDEYFRDEMHFSWSAMINFISKRKKHRFWMIHRPKEVPFKLSDPNYRFLRREDPCFDSCEELEKEIVSFLNKSDTVSGAPKNLVFYLPSNFSISQIHHLRSQLDSLFTSSSFKNRKIILFYTGADYPKVSIEWRHFWLDHPEPLFNVGAWLYNQFQYNRESGVSDVSDLDLNLNKNSPLEPEPEPKIGPPLPLPLSIFPSKKLKVNFKFLARMENNCPIFPDLVETTAGSGYAPLKKSKHKQPSKRIPLSFLKEQFKSLLLLTRLDSIYTGIESPTGSIYEVIEEFYKAKLEHALSNVFNYYGSLERAAFPEYPEFAFFQTGIQWFSASIEKLTIEPTSTLFGPLYFFLSSGKELRFDADNIPHQLKKCISRDKHPKSIIVDFLRSEFSLKPDQATYLIDTQLPDQPLINFLVQYSRFPLKFRTLVALYKGEHFNSPWTQLQFSSLKSKSETSISLKDTFPFLSNTFRQDIISNGSVFTFYFDQVLASIKTLLPSIFPKQEHLDPSMFTPALVTSPSFVQHITEAPYHVQFRLFLQLPLDFRYCLLFNGYIDIIESFFSPPQSNTSVLPQFPIPEVDRFPNSHSKTPEQVSQLSNRFFRLQKTFWAMQWVNLVKNQEVVFDPGIPLAAIISIESREEFKSILVSLLDFDSIKSIHVTNVKWFNDFQSILPAFELTPGSDTPYSAILNESPCSTVTIPLGARNLISCLTGEQPWIPWTSISSHNQDWLEHAENMVQLITQQSPEQQSLRSLLIHSWAWGFKSSKSASTISLLFTQPQKFWGFWIPGVDRQLGSYHWDCCIHTIGGSVLPPIHNLGSLQRAALVFISLSLTLGGILCKTSSIKDTEVLFTSYFKPHILNYLALQIVNSFNSLESQLSSHRLDINQIMHKFFHSTGPHEFGLGIPKTQDSIHTLHQKFSTALDKVVAQESKRNEFLNLPPCPLPWTPDRVYNRLMNLDWRTKNPLAFDFCSKMLKNLDLLQNLSLCWELVSFRFNLARELGLKFTKQQLSLHSLDFGLNSLSDDIRQRFVDKTDSFLKRFSKLVSINPEFQVECGIANIATQVDKTIPMENFFSYPGNKDYCTQLFTQVSKVQNEIVTSMWNLIHEFGGSNLFPGSSTFELDMKLAPKNAYLEFPSRRVLVNDLVPFLPKPGQEPDFARIALIWAWKYCWNKPTFSYFPEHLRLATTEQQQYSVNTFPMTILLNARSKLSSWKNRFLNFDSLGSGIIFDFETAPLEQRALLNDLSKLPVKSKFDSSESLFSLAHKIVQSGHPRDFDSDLWSTSPQFLFYYLQSILDRLTQNHTQHLDIDDDFLQPFTFPLFLPPAAANTDPESPFAYSLKGLFTLFKYRQDVISILGPKLFQDQSFDSGSSSDPNSTDLFKWLENLDIDTPPFLVNLFRVHSRPKIFQIVHFFSWLQVSLIPEYRQRIPAKTIEEEIEEENAPIVEEIDLSQWKRPISCPVFPMPEYLMSMKDFVLPDTGDTPLHQVLKQKDTEMVKFWVYHCPQLLVKPNKAGITPISLIFQSFYIDALKLIWELSRPAFRDYKEHFDRYLKDPDQAWIDSAEELSKTLTYDGFVKEIFMMQNPDI